MLLRDLILKKLASKIPYKDEEELNYKLNKYSSKIDEITGSLSLNWFLSLFHNAVPWQVSESFEFKFGLSEHFPLREINLLLAN